MADQPTSIAESFAGLKAAFQPSKTAGVDKTIQFDFSGREAGTWTLIVRNGTIASHQGPAENANATVAVDSDDWLKVLRGELNPVMAFTTGKVKIKGDMSLMLQFQNWFNRPA